MNGYNGDQESRCGELPALSTLWARVSCPEARPLQMKDALPVSADTIHLFKGYPESDDLAF